MTTYICFLRSVNVSGQNRIKMSELRDTFQNAGFLNVRTYIQSGNIIFDSDKAANNLKEKIYSAIKKSFGLSLDFVLMSSGELDKIIKECPYIHKLLQTDNTEIGTIYVGMASEKIPAEDIKKAGKNKSEKEEYTLSDKNIYLWLGEGFGKSKFAKSVLKMSVPITTRNWKTIVTVSKMA